MPWTRYGTVLTGDAGWENGGVLETSVIHDPETGLWKMWYRGGGFNTGGTNRQLGYATSDDGIDWTKYAGNPVFGGGVGGESHLIYEPTVIRIDGLYRLYYAERDTPALKLATSPTGYDSWTIVGTVMALPSGLTLWGNNYVWREGTSSWFMLIEAFNGALWQIYLATSANGVAFTLALSGNPLSTLQVAPGGMYGGMSMATPERIGGRYRLWYHAAAAAGNLPTPLYQASSADLITWTIDGSPILSPSGTDFEIDQVADPTVIEVDGIARLYYDACDNVANTALVRLATFPGTLAEAVGIPSLASGPTAGVIAAWVTDPAGTYIATLDRSAASPFRRFAFSLERGARPGAGSLEHHLDNALVAANPSLFAMGNLVWMRYRDKTMTWVIEGDSVVLDEQEHATDWRVITGRGTLQLATDRLVLPTAMNGGANLDPATWGAGDWKTTLDGTAASGQKVAPVTSTTGAVVGDPVEITGGGNRELGIIASIVAGVSVTLVDNLASTYVAGSRIISAAKQWRRFVNRAAGEMLWDLISESNARFATQIVRGTIETSGADGWTQDLRFDNVGENVIADVVKAYGEAEMDGLTFNYWNSPGIDRSASVIFEEGADVIRAERNRVDRDTATWAVAEGVGEGITAKLAIASDAGAIRRREVYVDAKDAGNLPLVQLRATAAIDELQTEDSIGVDVNETRFLVFTDYGLNDTVRVIAPSRGIDASPRIVALYLKEADDDTVRVSFDVNTPRQEYLIGLAERQRSVRQSVGIRNRQPQGQLVPYSFSGQGILDTGSPLYVYVKIPDRVSLIVEALVTLSFRQFLAPATAASSGGGSTSGASSASSSAAGGSATSSSAIGFSWTSSDHQHNDPQGGATGSPINGPADGRYVESIDSGHTHTVGNHTHGITHDHTTPNHGHGLTYGTFEETYPASHSVTLKVYERVDTTWTLRGTFEGLTDDLEDVELTAVMTNPGDWRLTAQSEAAQPNGGRLGCDVFGAITGAIQSA